MEKIERMRKEILRKKESEMDKIFYEKIVAQVKRRQLVRVIETIKEEVSKIEGKFDK